MVSNDGKLDYNWELINNDLLTEAGILVFWNRYTHQLDAVTLTNFDVVQEYKFKGRNNLLGYYIPDMNNENFTMKGIITIIISAVCLSIGYEVDAQNKTQGDVYLVPDPQTARWSYIETDSNGKQVATVYNSIESIEGDGVNGNIKLRIEEVPSASPQDTVKSFGFYCFKDGEYMADLRAGMEDNMFEGNELDSLVLSTIKEKYPDLPEEKKKEVIEQTKSEFLKISGEIRGIPRYPKVGKLPDYEFHLKFNILSMNVFGTDRKIVGTERIQTEAGTFDCFILEETITTKAMMMKDVEKIKSWYAYGIGLVKEITYDKNGKLISTMVLNEVNW